MKDKYKTKAQLIAKLEEARQRISELEQSKAEWVQVEEALRHREEQGREIITTLHGSCCITLNAKGEITLINRKGSEILGYEQEEIIGKNWFESYFAGDYKGANKSHF